MRLTIIVFAALSAGIYFFSCGEKTQKSEEEETTPSQQTDQVISVDAGNPIKPKPDPKGLEIPPMEPPVTRNTPDALAQAEASLLQAFSPLTAIKQRVFGKMPGCVGMAACALKPMDERMAELDRRSRDSTPTCFGESGKTYTESRLPGDSSFQYLIQCGEDLSGSSRIRLAFGVDDTYAYIRETSSVTGINGILGKIDRKTNDVEAWVINTTAPDNGGGASNEASTQTTQTTALHLKVDDAKGILEMVIAGNDRHSAEYACGFHLKASKELLFIKGIGSNGFATTANCSDPANAYEVCYDSVTSEERNLADCQEAGLTTLDLPGFNYTDIDEIELKAFNDDESIADAATDFKTIEE